MSSDSAAPIAEKGLSALPEFAVSMETALKGEIQRLKGENADLRREATRANVLQAELNILREVSLVQHEEKVPIRLQELERDNVRLRATNRSLEERVRMLELDDLRRRLVLPLSEPSTNDPKQQSKATEPPGKDGAAASVSKPISACAQCSMRIHAYERAYALEKEELRRQLHETQKELAAAQSEIRGIQLWLQPLVDSVQRFPHVAERQPLQELHSFASPTRYTTDINSQRAVTSASRK
jgi:hypothetical protein